MEEGAGEDVGEEVDCQQSLRRRRRGVWAGVVATGDDWWGGGHAVCRKRVVRGGGESQQCFSVFLQFADMVTKVHMTC